MIHILDVENTINKRMWVSRFILVCSCLWTLSLYSRLHHVEQRLNRIYHEQAVYVGEESNSANRHLLEAQPAVSPGCVFHCSILKGFNGLNGDMLSTGMRPGAVPYSNATGYLTPIQSLHYNHTTQTLQFLNVTRLLDLPLPTSTREAATKAYVDQGPMVLHQVVRSTSWVPAGNSQWQAVPDLQWQSLRGGRWLLMGWVLSDGDVTGTSISVFVNGQEQTLLTHTVTRTGVLRSFNDILITTQSQQSLGVFVRKGTSLAGFTLIKASLLVISLT